VSFALLITIVLIDSEYIEIESSSHFINLHLKYSGSIKAQKLKKGGTLYARLQKPPRQNNGALALLLRGNKLKNVEGLFKKSDPFYEVRRTYDGSGTWHAVYRSKQVKDNLNPKWEPATVDVNALCDGDLDRKIQVAVFDWESSGKHESMGQFETTGEILLLSFTRLNDVMRIYLTLINTYLSLYNVILPVNALIKASEQKSTFTPKKGSKGMGTIHVDQCKITGAETNHAAAVVQSAAADPTIVPMPVPMAPPVDQMANLNLGGGQKPTFVDYVTGNCDLGLVRRLVAILLHFRVVLCIKSDNILHYHFSVWLLTLRVATVIPANLAHYITSVVMDELSMDTKKPSLRWEVSSPSMTLIRTFRCMVLEPNMMVWFDIAFRWGGLRKSMV
jgi:hypothetical protein